MDHADHVALIADGVRAGGVGGRWLELGAGEGAFTLALADLLGGRGAIVATDREPAVLATLAARVSAASPGATLETRRVDFTQAVPDGPFEGVLAANCLHFVRDRRAVLQMIRHALRPAGVLVVVEYDADRGNPWVPYPFSFATWRREAVAAGFDEPRLLHRVPSRFLGAIYGADVRLPGRPTDDRRPTTTD